MKRSIFVLPLLLAALLAACSPAEETSPPEIATESSEVLMRTLISDSIGSDYLIVREDRAGNESLDAARLLSSAIEEATGQKLTLKTDWYQGDAGTPPQPHEILIGATNREESAALVAEQRGNCARDWAVRLAGEKILIWGGSPEALADAVSYFTETFVQGKCVSMPESFECKYEYPWQLAGIRIGEEDVTKYQIVIPANAGREIDAAAKLVQSYITDSIGFAPQIVTDTQTKYVSEYEILIGDTMRSAPCSADSYVSRDGNKLMIGGADGVCVYAAAAAFASGDAGTLTDGVYTVSDSFTVADPLLGGAPALKLYVEDRAKLGRLKHLNELMKSANAKDLGDVDVYGNCAVPVLYMPDGEVTDKQLAFANRVVRKVCGYMTTDIPPSKKDRLKGEVDFAANRLVRALYAPEGRVEEETAAALKRFFLNDDFQSMYYSENHMLMFRAARYLAACYYENETFAQYGMTGAELRKQEHDYLVDFLRFRARRGWGEFDSMGYTIENFLSLINLYDCAPDEDLRTLSQMTMDVLLLDMICDSTENGMYGGAHGRSYDSVTTDMRCRFFWVYQFYFGEHSYNEVPAAEREISLSNVPFAFTSTYRPHDIVYAIANGKQYPFSNYELSHNPASQFEQLEYGYLNKYTYNTALYSIGCVTHQDPYPDNSPDKKTEDTQQTNWSLVFAENSKASITVHHPGGTNAHNYWYGDADCNCNHLFGQENVVCGIFYMPANAANFNFIHAYVPKAQYDEIIERPEDGCVFVRVGDAYAVLRFSAPYTRGGKDPAKELVIYDGTRRSDIRIAMACEAGDRETYGSFAAFVAAMEKKELRFTRDTLTLEYGNIGIRLERNKLKQVEEHNYLDGVEQTYPYTRTFDSPYMKSEADSGVIEVTYGAMTRTMNFMNVTDTVAKQ